MKTLFNRLTLFTIALLFLSCFNNDDEKEMDEGTTAQNYPTLIEVTGGTLSSIGNGTITVSDYSISKTEVTVAEYRTYCTATGTSMPSRTPRWGWNDDDPIVNVSWNDAMAYCTWLSQQLNKTITLPTEKQWEFAARGGNQSNGYTYSGSNDLNTVGWHYDNSNSKAHEVAQKTANELGLYDMSGNVLEWCLDWYDDDNDVKVLRGGSWGIDALYCSVAVRYSDDPGTDIRSIDFGFRVVSL